MTREQIAATRDRVTSLQERALAHHAAADAHKARAARLDAEGDYEGSAEAFRQYEAACAEGNACGGLAMIWAASCDRAEAAQATAGGAR